MRDHKFECRIDLSHPSFTPFWELANEIGRDCQIKPVELKATPTKKRRGWTPAARRNASFATYAAVASGRRNTNGINYRPVWAQSLNPMDMIVSG